MATRQLVAISTFSVPPCRRAGKSISYSTPVRYVPISVSHWQAAVCHPGRVPEPVVSSEEVADAIAHINSAIETLRGRVENLTAKALRGDYAHATGRRAETFEATDPEQQEYERTRYLQELAEWNAKVLHLQACLLAQVQRLQDLQTKLSGVLAKTSEVSELIDQLEVLEAQLQQQLLDLQTRVVTVLSEINTLSAQIEEIRSARPAAP